MSEAMKPRVYGYCDAGCRRETILKEDFLRSASLYEIYPNEGGVWTLELKKQYKIFAPKDENGAFDFTLRVDYFTSSFHITTTTNDEYADYFVFRLLDYEYISGTGVKIVYEIEGNRYVEIISNAAGVYPVGSYLTLSGATQVFLYNDDATVYARDGAAGKDGADGKDGNSGTYYTVAIPAATDEDKGAWFVDHDEYTRRIEKDWITEDLFINVCCAVNEIFTEHGLSITLDNGFMEIYLTSLPANACTLELVVVNTVNGGEL